jgi:uncharacterized Zn-finger protein
MSPPDPNQPIGDRSNPFNLTSSLPRLPIPNQQTIPEVVISDSTIIPNIRVNSCPDIPSIALNSVDINFEYLASSPSPSLRQQKRPQPHPALNRPLAKIPRITNTLAIPFSFKPTIQPQTDQIDQTNQYIL